MVWSLPKQDIQHALDTQKSLRQVITSLGLPTNTTVYRHIRRRIAEDDLTVDTIELNCKKDSVVENVTRRTSDFQTTKEELEDLIHSQKMSYVKIGEMFGVSDKQFENDVKNLVWHSEHV